MKATIDQRPSSGSNCPEKRVFAEEVALPTPRWIDLKTIDHVRVEMARIYREARSGRLEMQKATRLVFILSQIGKLIEADRQHVLSGGMHVAPTPIDTTPLPTLPDMSVEEIKAFISECDRVLSRAADSA